MNLYQSQNSIVEALQIGFKNYATNFKALHLPEMSKGFDSTLIHPVAYVVYVGSVALPTVTNYGISQPRKVRFDIECRTRLLYGPTGLFELRNIVESILVGFSPQNCKSLYLLKDDPAVSGEYENTFWIHILSFECETMLVQATDNEEIVVPAFTKICE